MLVLQVLRSLAFLHSLGLIHSDLKPENILIKSYSRYTTPQLDFISSNSSIHPFLIMLKTALMVASKSASRCHASWPCGESAGVQV